MSEKRILCIGLCCLDIITVCESYPEEDTDQSALAYYWQRGGNASNSSTVLAVLGADVEFLGVLVKGQEYMYLEKDFHSLGIKIDNCVVLEEGTAKASTAIIVINRQNGSRTIMASIDRTQLKYEDFDSRINLQNYQWMHFEGRPNVENMKAMMEKINQYNATAPEQDRVPISLELEKGKNRQLMDLMQYVDFTFISKEFASSLGYKTKEETVEVVAKTCRKGSSVICAWGDDGAAAKCGSCETVTSPIFPPETLVDTLAAGDTFNAATILALARGKDLKDAITFGCKVAGAKCGMEGVKGLTGCQQYL